MKYTEKYTINWHDTGCDRSAAPSRILGYMQETASRHCRFLGHDLDVLRDEKALGFVVIRFSVEMLAPLYAYDEVTVDTWVPESHGLFFNRCYEIRRGSETVARGLSVSSLLNLKTRDFMRVTDYDFGFEEEAMIELSKTLPTRLRFKKDLSLSEVAERRIVCSDLDYNLHMNNTRYADMLSDYLPSRTEKRITSLVLSYLHEARYGDTLRVFCGEEQDSESGTAYCLRALSEDGTPVTEARITVEPITCETKNNFM
ncbi:MAG: hypothetical protein IKC26_02505 [Clostridia bacterium]|nr:hypothetical protein [Clostridia bacterium]